MTEGNTISTENRTNNSSSNSIGSCYYSHYTNALGKGITLSLCAQSQVSLLVGLMGTLLYVTYLFRQLLHPLSTLIEVNYFCNNFTFISYLFLFFSFSFFRKQGTFILFYQLFSVFFSSFFFSFILNFCFI